MKYLLALFGTEAEEQTEMNPEDIRAMMDPWNELNKELVAAGVYIAGEGLQPSATATSVKREAGDERVVTDGPFAESKEQIGGFYLLECADLDEALEWAKKVPVQEGSTVEVRPVMDFTEFGYDDPANLAQETAS